MGTCSNSGDEGSRMTLVHKVEYLGINPCDLIDMG